MHIRPAQPGDAARIHELVTAAGLPTDGLDATWLTLVAQDGNQLEGLAALEKHGADTAPTFLLRSVVVQPQQQGKGVGGALVTTALAAADAEAGGTATVALLTETADGYFDRFGFSLVERDQLPASLSASPELVGACPDTAWPYLRVATQHFLRGGSERPEACNTTATLG